MIKNTLMRGLKVTIPLLLTFLLVIWAGQTIEGLFGSFLKPILPFYFPGLGALLGLVMIFLVGLSINAWVVQAIWSWGERVIDKIPFVKTIYSSLTDMVNLMDQSKGSLGAPVIVNVEGVKLLGFITCEHPGAFVSNEIKESDEVVVYLPMSYQIGGYMVVLPRSKITALSVSTQEVMKFVLTAGITKKN